MAFNNNSFVDDNYSVSPGSIGGKIKRYRELKGWSQKELGIKAGFSPSTADVRIAQYENNKRVPRENIIEDIANALSIDKYALYDADMRIYNIMFHALFDMEDFHSLHPVKIGDDYYLEFSGENAFGQIINKADYYEFLDTWSKRRQNVKIDTYPTPEYKAKIEKEYAIWKAEYPHSTRREAEEKYLDAIRERQLQAELDVLYAKRNCKSELNKLLKHIEVFMPEVEAEYTPIKYESELIYLIKETMEKGLPIEEYSPEVRFEIDYDHDDIHLFSIKSEDITKDDNNIKLYARLICAINTIKQFNIKIMQNITSKDKVLYVTFTYPVTQYRYFSNLNKSWEDIYYILKRQPFWSEKELDDLEDKFRAKITGKNDILFSDDLDVDE